MYAVIQTGGKQYRVTEGTRLRVEKLDVDAGTTIDFDKVLMVSDGNEVTIGKPYLEGGKVTAEVLDQGRAKKIEIVKFRRRKHYRRRAGHRQYFTEVRVTGISPDGSPIPVALDKPVQTEQEVSTAPVAPDQPAQTDQPDQES